MASSGDVKKGVVEEKGKLESEYLEEDDEFEEFPAEEWEVGDSEEAADPDPHVWEDNWDDEILHDDFAKQLQTELEKTQADPSPTAK